MKQRSGNIVNYKWQRNRGKGIDKQKRLMYNNFALWKRGTI